MVDIWNLGQSSQFSAWKDGKSSLHTIAYMGPRFRILGNPSEFPLEVLLSIERNSQELVRIEPTATHSQCMDTATKLPKTT